MLPVRNVDHAVVKLCRQTHSRKISADCEQNPAQKKTYRRGRHLSPAPTLLRRYVSPVAHSEERTSPVFDSRMATQRVARKFDKIMTRITVRGTQRKAPTIPQIEPQMIKEMITVKGLRFNVSPMTF